MNAHSPRRAADRSACSAGGMALAATTCIGKFPNPITDICWSCVLPLTIGTAAVGNFGDQEDVPEFNPSNPVCSCIVNPTIGLAVGFWEPSRIVEVVRRPFCLPSLGGVDLNPGIAAPEHGRRVSDYGDKEAFYQAHFYFNPVLTWLEVLGDYPCLEQGSLDIAYLTEVDPLWNDDELTLILNPGGGAVRQSGGRRGLRGRLRGRLDRLRPRADVLVRRLPGRDLSDGWMGQPAHGRGALFAADRAALHREDASRVRHLGLPRREGAVRSLLPAADGQARLQDPDAVSRSPTRKKILGKCCQPFGRQTVLWGAGREIPVKGEDFAYMLFRKKNCCVGY